MGDPVIAELDATGQPYEVVPCDPDLADTAAFVEAYGFGLDESVNAIVVVGKADPPRHALCLTLANCRLDVNRVVRKRLGTRKASFAPADITRDLTGMEIGGVGPFGITSDLPIWVDARIMDCERIILGGGGRDRKLLVPPATLAAHLRVEVVADLAQPVEPSPSADTEAAS
ncbi:MAG: YbaK/EbsC family protein [Actinomycetota bacterium]